MKKKYRYTHNATVTTLAIAFLIILAACAIVNIISIVEYEGDLPPVFAICSLILITLQLGIVAALIFNSRFTLSDKCLTLTFGMVWSRKNYDDILLFREDRNNKLLLMYFKRKIGGEICIEHLKISIKPELYADFVKSAREKNDKIIYELFDKEEKQ